MELNLSEKKVYLLEVRTDWHSNFEHFLNEGAEVYRFDLNKHDYK